GCSSAGLQGIHELLEGQLGSEWTVPVRTARDEVKARRRIQSRHERSRPIDLGFDAFESRRRQTARRAAGSRWDKKLGAPGRLDDHRAGCNHRGQLGVSELLEQTENVPIDWLPPDIVAIIEIAADAHGAYSGIKGRGVERQCSAFAVPEHADRLWPGRAAA